MLTRKPGQPLILPFISYENSSNKKNVNLYENLVFKFRLFPTFFQKELAVPVDSEAVSKCRKTTERVASNVDNCYSIIDNWTLETN